MKWTDICIHVVQGVRNKNCKSKMFLKYNDILSATSYSSRCPCFVRKVDTWQLTEVVQHSIQSKWTGRDSNLCPLENKVYQPEYNEFSKIMNNSDYDFSNWI